MMHPRTTEEPVRPAPSLKIAYAVARQRTQDLHFHAVVELIERARGEVAAPQALSIYARVHNLSEPETQGLKNRVMVHMGRAQDADIQHLPNTFVAIDGVVEWDISASLLERIRKRVGGRRRHALREWIELHTGHVEVELQRLHVECLRDARAAAGPEVRLEDLARAYASELRVRESLQDALYFGLLDKLFREQPGSDQAEASANGSGGAQENAAADAGTEGMSGGALRGTRRPA